MVWTFKEKSIPSKTPDPTHTPAQTPTQSLRPEYKVCADLSNIPNDYNISYIVSTDENITKIADHDLNVEKSFTPFYINASLTKETSCNKTFLATLYASTFFKCISVTVDMFPKECRKSDTIVKKSSKKVQKAIIIPVSCVAIIIVFVVVFNILYIRRKRRVQAKYMPSEKAEKSDN